MNTTDWEFRAGDEIEKPAVVRLSIGDGGVEHNECIVKRRLMNVDSGKRYYHVETPLGLELCAARTLEGVYRVVEGAAEQPRTDGGVTTRERVVFTDAYDGMAEELDVLVGDAGFIVPASRKIPADDRVLVQFDENRTGRPGGERHWIPEGCLEPEGSEIRADGGRVRACPQCNSSRLKRRKPKSSLSPLPASAPKYRCRDCGHTFDSPTERESFHGLSEAAKALVSADPDEFEIRTDGGADADRLAHRKHSRSSTDPATRRRCPECGSLQVSSVTRGTEHPATAEPVDRCDKCGAEFGAGVDRDD